MFNDTKYSHSALPREGELLHCDAVNGLNASPMELREGVR